MSSQQPTRCKRRAFKCIAAFAGCLRSVQLTVILLFATLSSSLSLAGEVFIYSSQSTIRGLDLGQGTDRFLSSSPFATGVNALAYNLQAGIVYYGDQTSVYRWDPALGIGASAHTLMNDFSAGPLTADIQNINSTAGSYLSGKYYVGSENNAGYIQDIFELTMSIDGTQVVSVQPLDILSACACSDVQLGGFGDVAALLEGGIPVLYGSSADLSGNGQGTSAGRWKFTPATSSFQLLSTGSGGQMSSSPSGTLYSNVGNAVREVDRTTGAIIGPTLITTSSAIYDFTGGFALDFGDAPDSYGSAFHRLDQTTSAYIGAIAPDNEAGSLGSSANGLDGAGDDQDGSDDEDAVTGTLSISSTIGSYSLTVQCSAGSRVAGWLDANINGVFDSNERNGNHPVTCSGGQANLIWSGLSSAASGNTYLRLRASNNASAVSRATGVASDGEIEDHPVVLTGGVSTGSCPAGSTSQVYSASDLPINIGPNAGTTAVSTISVSDVGSVVDVNVLDVQGRHTYINDLFFDLSHAGSTRRLYGPSCGSQNNFSFGFDDAASGNPPCPPTDGGTYPARQSLSVFNGQSLSGDWQLRITDRYNGDAGVLESWQLELCSAGSVVETPDLILGKNASVSGNQVEFQLSLINAGNTELNGLSITDDLAAVFGAGNYSIVNPVSILSPATGFVANSAYDGDLDNELIASSSALLIGEQVDLVFTISVDTIVNSSTAGQYANQALALASSPSGLSVSDLSGAGLNLAIDTDDVTLFELDTSASLAGYVFEDSSSTANSSHDGVIQAGEQGVSSRVVSAIDVTGSILSTTTTDTNGYWQLSIADTFLNQTIQIVVQPDTLTQFVSESSVYTAGVVTDGSVAVSPGLGESLEQINVGVIRRPDFIQDNSGSVQPDTSLSYAHRYTASTHGELDVVVTSSATPENIQWVTSLYADANCNGLVDSADQLWSSPITMIKDQEICLLVIEVVPASALNGTIRFTGLNAQLTVADESGTGHGLQIGLTNQDITTVVRIGAGRLVIDKTVRNVSLGGVELLSNTALPGHVLEYNIGYVNAGDGPLTEMTIEDAAPPFTQVLGASVVCGTTPAALTCTPAVSGQSVSWEFSGPLSAGDQGTVSYQVSID
ncbi:MAG: GEVED domain-containing protein [Granulosicoccus sp.]